MFFNNKKIENGKYIATRQKGNRQKWPNFQMDISQELTPT